MHETQWGSTILNKIQIWQVFFLHETDMFVLRRFFTLDSRPVATKINRTLAAQLFLESRAFFLLSPEVSDRLTTKNQKQETEMIR